MYFLVGILAMVLMTGPVVAQTLTPEQQVSRESLHGWNHARWGMSDEEVIAAFGGVATRLAKVERDQSAKGAGRLASVGIDRHPVGDLAVNVRFLFESDSHLGAVILHSVNNPTGKTSPEELGAGVQILRSEFAKFEKLLTEKYGARTLGDDERLAGGLRRYATWTLPATTIELELVHFTGLNFANLTLMYSPASAKAVKDSL